MIIDTVKCGQIPKALSFMCDHVFGPVHCKMDNCSDLGGTCDVATATAVCARCSKMIRHRVCFFPTDERDLGLRMQDHAMRIVHAQIVMASANWWSVL